MRILGLLLENIRSYKRGIIVLPHSGITVIHGPSGSGKTSLLMSISYALFGIATGSIKNRDLFEAYEHPHGADLLRVDSTKGRVRILVSAGGRLYAIERWIAREGSSFVSREGVIEEYVLTQGHLRLANRRYFTSRMEMDEYVASIIGLREKYRERGSPRPLVYPSALYVPQFNVHEVLQLSEDERKEIVERALGLDKYKLFRANYEKISKALNQKLKDIEVKLSDITRRLKEKSKESIVREKVRLLAEYERINKERALIELEYSRTREEENLLQARLRELEVKKQEQLKLLDEYNKNFKKISEIRKKICELLGVSVLSEEPNEVEQLKKVLENKLDELKHKKVRLDEALAGIELEIRGIEEGLKGIREERIKQEKVLSEYETLIKLGERALHELENEYRKIEKMVAEGICPVCRQPIAHKHGYMLLSEVANKIDAQKSQLVSLLEKKDKTLRDLNTLRQSEDEFERRRESLYFERQKILSERDTILEELRRESQRLSALTELASQLRALKADLARVNIDFTTKALNEIDNEVSNVVRSLKSVEQKIKYTIEKREIISKEMGRIEEIIRTLDRELGEIEMLENELNRIQREKQAYERLGKLLDLTFQVVDEVERRLLRILAGEFRRYFYEYISKLMYDQPIEVIVSDDFNVVEKVRVGRTTYAVPSLSGGQNIAVSLAYRLALNTTVRQYSPALQRSVLILDEPTTGFSNELVKRLRDLLRKLSGLEGQILVVTHDDTLIEAGDCKIALSLDLIEHRTNVEYTECNIQDSYKKIVEDILLGRITASQVQPVELNSSFEPKVTTSQSNLTT